MLVVRTGKEQEPYWNDSAENVIAAFIAHVCATEGNAACRNLRVRERGIASRRTARRVGDDRNTTGDWRAGFTSPPR